MKIKVDPLQRHDSAELLADLAAFQQRRFVSNNRHHAMTPNLF
jgi:hypothetical protein